VIGKTTFIQFSGWG